MSLHNRAAGPGPSRPMALPQVFAKSEVVKLIHGILEGIVSAQVATKWGQRWRIFGPLPAAIGLLEATIITPPATARTLPAIVIVCHDVCPGGVLLLQYTPREVLTRARDTWCHVLPRLCSAGHVPGTQSTLQELLCELCELCIEHTDHTEHTG